LTSRHRQRSTAPPEPPVPASEIRAVDRPRAIRGRLESVVVFRYSQTECITNTTSFEPSGGHFNAGRKHLRALSYVAESDGVVMATVDGLRAAGEVPPVLSTPAERLPLWCGRLPSPAPEMLRTLAARGERYMDVDELAAALGIKPSGGHWNSGIAVLRNNGLIETDGRRYRTVTLFRE
jgi:hypothetical protein